MTRTRRCALSRPTRRQTVTTGHSRRHSNRADLILAKDRRAGSDASPAGAGKPATKTIKLTDDDLANIPRLAFDYGQGGYEDRLLKAFTRELGPNLGRD